MFRAGFWVGLMAGLAMVLFMVAFRLALGTPSLPEVVADWFTLIVPPRAFDFLLENLQTLAKPLLFIGLLIASVLAGGVLGGAYALSLRRFNWWAGHPWRRGSLLGVGLWLLTGLLVAPAMDAGFFGASLQGGATAFGLSTLVSEMVYALSLSALLQRLLPQAETAAPQPVDAGRRDFLKKVAIGSAVVAGSGFVIRSLVQGIGSVQPSRVFGTSGQMPPEVTPTNQFYVISKNFVDPQVGAGSWTLKIKGEVDNPLTFTYEDLQTLPSVEQFTTLTCISNPIGGDLISNARWKGVPLRHILEMASMRESARKVAFFAEDGYSDSIPVSQALRDEVLVAYEMNGQPLTDKHGFPARMLIPGLYGLKSVKWLKAVQPVDFDFQGYWQDRGWSDEAVVKTMSRIDVPPSREDLPLETVLVGGVAFAGLRGISRVEFSTDKGATWHPANVEKPLSPYTWVLWTQHWEPPGPGIFPIQVRATDGEEDVQVSQRSDSLPDGASGHHRILATFKEPLTAE